MRTTPAQRVYTATDVDLGAGVVVWTEDVRHLYRVSMQVVFANYTSVTVKMQGSIDGTTFADITGMSVTTTGAIVSAEVGPYEKIRIHATATLTGGTDTLSVYLKRAMG